MAEEIAIRETGDPGEVPIDAPVPEMPSEETVLEEFNSRFKSAKDHADEWRTEARELYDLIAGRQWSNDDEATMLEQGRPMVTFNISGKYLDSVTGLQVNNRQEIRYLPREIGDAQVNELLTNAVKWGRDLTDIEDDETDAFYDAILCGYGWVQGFLDRDTLPEGVPTGQRIDPLEMYPDPAARKRNLTDSRFMVRVKFVDKDEYEALTGYTVADDQVLAELVAEEDDVLRHIEEPQDYRNASQADTRRRSRMPVAEYEFWNHEKRFLVRSRDYGSTTMEPHEWKVYEDLLKRAKAPYTVSEIRQRVFYRARIASGKVCELKRSPYQEGFTFHAITGKRDRNRGTFYGIGRALLDPQKWVNKFFSTILYSLMVGAKGGLLAEENTFTDQNKAEESWANPAAITFVKDGALQKGKVMPKPAPAYPEGLERLMTFTMNSIPQVSGLNMELLGLAERVQAGVVEAQRKQSAMAVIAWAFDAMKRYYRSMGRQMAAYVRDYMTEGTLILVNGESGRQYIPLVKSEIALKYDVVVDEAPTSVNMKERVWMVLETLIPQFLQAGLKIPQEILDYSPLPPDLVEKWRNALKPDPKTQQIQDSTIKATLDKLVAETTKLQAGAQLDVAKAQEIFAEIQKPGEDPNAQAQLELLKAQVEAQVEARIAEFKTNREAETRLMVEQMKIDSAERIAAMEAAIDARLERSRMEADERTERQRLETDERMERQRQESDASTKMTVAAIARGGKEEPEEDPTALITEAIGELKDAVETLSKRKVGLKMKRDKDGNLSEIETGDGRKLKVRRDKQGNLSDVSED